MDIIWRITSHVHIRIYAVALVRAQHGNAPPSRQRSRQRANVLGDTRNNVPIEKDRLVFDDNGGIAHLDGDSICDRITFPSALEILYLESAID